MAPKISTGFSNYRARAVDPDRPGQQGVTHRRCPDGRRAWGLSPTLRERLPDDRPEGPRQLRPVAAVLRSVDNDRTPDGDQQPGPVRPEHDVLSLHEPLLLARQIAAIELLSEGRDHSGCRTRCRGRGVQR